MDEKENVLPLEEQDELELSEQGAEEAPSKEELTEEELLNAELEALFGPREDVKEPEASDELDEQAVEEPEPDTASDQGQAEPAPEVDPLKSINELREQYVSKDEPAPDELLIQKEEARLREVAAQLQVNPRAGLPNLVYAGNNPSLSGRSIYDMDQAQLNEYLIELKDNGNELQAGHVQAAYFNYQSRYESYYNLHRAYQNDIANLEQYKDTLSWQRVGLELSAKIPGLTEEHRKLAGQYINQQIQADPYGYGAKVKTKEGRVAAAVQALDTLGIFAELEKTLAPAQATEQKKTPSAPDTRAVSKKVQVNKRATPGTINGKKIADMTTEELRSVDPKLVEAALDEELKGIFR